MAAERERQQKEAELRAKHGKTLLAGTRQLYEAYPAAVGVAVLFLECSCLVLRPFDQNGRIVGEARLFALPGHCSADHLSTLDEAMQSAPYKALLWRDQPEEFDQKYGNDRRVEIASKLFPPHDAD
ncbi:MAG: hypothetical protein JRJ12_08145 [Deltaproteobacteria bacterium]|nr:hypothetical protein [Deltaproteobacteria bacterium]MBW2070723.1 hypothetical protein [Deltaproteobacteria bacterium]